MEGGRYGEEGYRVMRSAIERFNAWLKTYRRAIIRYEKLAIMFQAIITFTCIIIHNRVWRTWQLKVYMSSSLSYSSLSFSYVGYLVFG